MTFEDLSSLYHQPLFDLLTKSRAVHQAHWPENEVQLCTLLSIKTGGCSEDCSYCSQSAHYSTGIEKESLMDRADIMRHASAAVDNGSTRFCMGAAWREVKDGSQFDDVLEMVSGVGVANRRQRQHRRATP